MRLMIAEIRGCFTKVNTEGFFFFLKKVDVICIYLCSLANKVCK